MLTTSHRKKITMLRKITRGLGLGTSGTGRGQVVGSCEWGNGPSRFYKIREISRLSEDLLGSREELCSKELAR
jgi:hypothetical protein